MPVQRASLFVLGLIAIGGCSGEQKPQPAGDGVKLIRVGVFGDAPEYNQPTDIAAPDDGSGRLFVVQKKGLIRVLRRGRVLTRPFLDLTRDVKSDQLAGLLALAFAPDYRQSGRFYLYFTDRARRVRVSEFQRSSENADVAEPDSARSVLTITHRFPKTNDLGGDLEFGPDGMLYVSTGDGQIGAPPDLQGVEQSQRLDLLHGKVLRIDPRPSGGRPYTVPTDNPFVDRAGARPEVLVSGLRNPWRFSFDGKDLWLPDLGQDEWEEVNRLTPEQAPGANLGWPAYEGRHRFDMQSQVRDATRPLFEYPHRPGGQCGGAVIGGYVVRDPSVPALDGRYVYGDWCKRTVRSFDPADPRGTDAPVPAKLRFVSSFGRDADGHVYVADDVAVYRLAASRGAG